MQQPIWELDKGDSPLIAAAIHDGHAVRPEVDEHLALSEDERRREEDPFTRRWTHVADTRVVGRRSRFEIDLNRPRDKAVYLQPADAWGLDVWETPPPPALVERSLNNYDAFYDEMERLLEETAERHGRFVVFDIHAYNHRRKGPEDEPADPELNPEINIGTGSMDRERWAPVVEPFMEALRHADGFDRPLDVRENVKFRGGHFSEWVHETFPAHGCALAIEFKKTFMNEWTGEPDDEHIQALVQALDETVPVVLEALRTG